MSTLRGSVGDGGRNDFDDVRTVQRLLNEHALDSGLILPLLESGILDSITLDAIRSFQSRALHVAKPDGRVDPGGRTIRALAAGRTGGTDGPGVATRSGVGRASLVQVPPSGPGYYAYEDDSNRFSTSATLASIRDLAERVDRELGISIGIGDISLAGGGKMPGHDSHRVGRDVDIRPIRRDGAHAPVQITSPDYDHERTAELVKLLREDTSVSLILFNDTTIPGVRWHKKHHNHLHVSYRR